MPNASGRKGNPDGKRLAAIDQLLMAGMKLGPAKKQEAINKSLRLFRSGHVVTAGSVSGICARFPNLRSSGARPDKAKKSGKTGPIPQVV